MPKSRTHVKGQSNVYHRVSHKIGGRTNNRSVKHAKTTDLENILKIGNCKRDTNMIRAELNRREIR